MCGIVAYIGQQQASPIIVKGLKRLEYRGFDSTGISLYYGKEIQTIKTTGKVSDLKVKLQGQEPVQATIGIGHTSWATHDVPNDVNAHPKTSNSGDLVVAHNGIIENYASLKEELIQRGYTFSSVQNQVINRFVMCLTKGKKNSLS